MKLKPPTGGGARSTGDDQRTTHVFHVKGSFRIDLTEGSYTLEREGDYLVWGPGIDHSWEALQDCLVTTVRFPSVGDDEV